MFMMSPDSKDGDAVEPEKPVSGKHMDMETVIVLLGFMTPDA